MRIVSAVVRAYLSLFVWIAADQAHARAEHDLIVWGIEEAYQESRDRARPALLALMGAIATHLVELQPVALLHKTVDDQRFAPRPGHIRAGRVALAGTAVIVVAATIGILQSSLRPIEGLHVVAQARAESEGSSVPVPIRGPFKTQEEALGAAGVQMPPTGIATEAAGTARLSRPTDGPELASEPKLYCIVRIAPVAPGAIHSDIAAPACFDTLEPAVLEASGVAVEFDRRRQPGDISDLLGALGASTRTTAIAVSFAEPRFLDGGTLIWLSNDGGCDSGARFAAARMPAGWDDVISSTVGLAGCTTVTHYEAENFEGTRIDCTCDAMILMHDRTSSIRWSR